MTLKISDLSYEERVQEGIENDFMRQAVASAQGRFRSGRETRAEEIGNWEDWRALGEEIRRHTLNNLDYYLEQLSDEVSKRGGHVFFAEKAEDANAYIQDIVKKKKAKKVVKSKSMVTEEIGLNQALEEVGADVVESDLGEWILQLDDDPPSHIVTPALHKNKEQIRETFAKKRGYTKSEKPEELALFAREQLREEFLSCDIGITGCNFAVAESGAITFVTNEGNARMVTTIPDTQITVMGMERIVPTWEELDILVSLLTRAAVGQKITSYVTAITGTRLAGETDGPEEFHLVIVDNGRSKILGTEFQSTLHCIRCAACINVCPVYRHIGGHAYNSIYPGPIGAVLSPLLDGYESHQELPYASTLCGACTEVCPVKIPLHELLILHRKKMVEEEKMSPKLEQLAMKGYAKWASNAAAYKMGAALARPALKPWIRQETIKKGPGPLKEWTVNRDFPAPAKETFRAWFKKRNKEAPHHDEDL
ncbi:L-lactate dehydrogenase complex protein LldF [Cerasibacillus quisquiliarum]|uniref:Lactate utilization protein B n=1 Tax=Cerasibacillus quisquiliarum TaxID=227865 RepID=A0A511V0U2_9BACI|nr:LutB/LldF family L-lactate oxidation iron-sulfur protein [Cerasibacillus quisquiliarum]MBB5146635.1 L-lactate dehydrogenase complex protein LldF [Cerasibacillus quisquiliarum]GEN31333.1 lactate utilization protein B [Cerasibacillus quisquiliarum]